VPPWRFEIEEGHPSTSRSKGEADIASESPLLCWSAPHHFDGERRCRSTTTSMDAQVRAITEFFYVASKQNRPDRASRDFIPLPRLHGKPKRTSYHLQPRSDNAHVYIEGAHPALSSTMEARCRKAERPGGGARCQKTGKASEAGFISGDPWRAHSSAMTLARFMPLG
jgi:hypothetical protein